MCDPLIEEFYVNATLKEDYIECWVRGHAFTLDVGDIDRILGHGDLDHEDFIPFKDRMVSLEMVQFRLGAHLYTIIAKAIRTISRAKLVVPSLIMRILHENGVQTP